MAQFAMRTRRARIKARFIRAVGALTGSANVRYLTGKAAQRYARQVRRHLREFEFA